MQKAPEHLRFAVMAIDAVLLSMVHGELCALVSAVNRPPHYVNTLGFLGGIIHADETAEQACERILLEKGGIKKSYVEQLYTFSAIGRDKRNRVVSVAYLGFVGPDIAATYHHVDARFVPVKQLKKMAYDHREMLTVAEKRLQGKLSYTTIAQRLLPRHFTLTELQQVYEHVLHRSFDKRNFRKKIIALGIVRETGRMQEGVKNRPAALYEFVSKTQQEISLFA